MMEDIKLLVEMVANLPSMALWVIAAFWAYKVICIGSLYGVVRLSINKAYAWGVNPKVLPVQELNLKLGAKCIDEATFHAINAQLMRLYSPGGFIHMDVAMKLAKSVDKVLEDSK